MDGLPLNAIEVRVLGSLIEKEMTTPDYYPLSLNALTNACNQINNREPVVAYGEPEVLRAVEALRDKHLAYVLSGATNRVMKYGHKAADVFQLPPAQLAALAVLLLRGPQTVGEIRGRTGRMHEFKDLAEVQAVLQDLAARPDPLVAIRPRQAGTKEARYAHLLDGGAADLSTAGLDDPAPAASGPAPGADLGAAIEGLRREVAELRQQFAEFRKQFE